MTTAVATGPVVGLKLEMVGTGALIVKLLAEVAFPFGVVTAIFPVLVPLATTAVIWVALFTVKLAAGLELNVTDVAPVRLVPVITTDAPAVPLVGLKLLIAGVLVMVKLVAETAVPFGVPTMILPVDVPLATVAVI
jgi:hypothetical protein